MHIDEDGDFVIVLEAEWAVKADPMLVVVQNTETYNYNILDKDPNPDINYYPAYLTSQDCEGEYAFSCTRTLEQINVDGTVYTPLDVGSSPNHASDTESSNVDRRI